LEKKMAYEETMSEYSNDDVLEVYGNVVKWSSTDGETFTTSGKSYDTLPAGIYNVAFLAFKGIVFEKFEPTSDEIIMMPDSVSEEIIHEIDDFWKKQEIFEQFNFLWKRGVLMYGPPGSGKTCTLQLICNKLVENGGVVLYASNGETASDALRLFRSAEPERPVIVALEDIDTMNYGDLLPLLDGEDQVNNVVFIATTNHPENLGERIINRPSRFDLVKYIGHPDAPSRKVYLTDVLNRANYTLANIDEWVEKSDGFSLAHLKELVIMVLVFNNTLDQAITRLRVLISGAKVFEKLAADKQAGEVSAPLIYKVDKR
jgi:AAA+ superfamily predicted ATPase